MKPKQKLSIILIMITIGTLFLNGCMKYKTDLIQDSKENIENQDSNNKQLPNTEEEGYKRKNLTFLKMVSSEDCMYSFDKNEISRLKAMNINSIRICPLYDMMPDGDVRLVGFKNLYRDLIRKAHNEGWAVLLEPNTAGPQGFPVISDPRYLNILYNIAERWAKIAEKENVEFFSPLNEPNSVFVNEDLLNKWIKMSQELRYSFSGNLVLKLADIGPERIENIEHYDYLAFDIMWGDNNYEELKDYLDIATEKANNLKERYNLKGVFFGELGAENSMVDESTQAEIFRIILNETWNKIDGYCFLGWSNLEFSFKDRKGEDVIKEWFSR